MKNTFSAGIALAGLLMSSSPAIAQTEQQDLYDLSLEELLNISVVSASKEKERLFDAPVAVYSVTRDEISRAGIQSIPEALRLIPGVVVREVNNGNYDIHLRGFDNTARYTFGQNQVNTITLVMINNRPVFNHNMGGTLWEALPVDIADVERIEVVCGPSSPLFGPNAVSGVVNIITREFMQSELLVSGQLQGSLPGGSGMGSVAVGQQINSKLSAGVTANYQSRIRLDDEQYIFFNRGAGGFYMKSEEYEKAKVEQKELDYRQSLLRKGLNAYVSYSPKEQFAFDFSAGMQAAEAQKVVFTTLTPTTYTESKSQYANLNSKIYNLSVRSSYVQGKDDLHRMSDLFTAAYDYKIIDVAADYDFKLGSTLRLRPSVGYQTSFYSDLDYIDRLDNQGQTLYPLGGLINSEQSISDLSGSLRADFVPVKGLRLIGSGRLDKFNVNDDLYFSYQFASTYSLNDKWMARAVHGKSYSGVFYSMAYVDSKIPTSRTSMYYAHGNKDARAAANTLSEIGLRGNVLSNLQFDLTLFMQELQDVSLLRYQASQTLPNGLTISHYGTANLPYTVHQKGATLSVSWMPNKQWQIRPFVTLQQTESQNFDYYNNPTQTNIPYVGENSKHKSTPGIFGGCYVNYSPLSKLNINASAYYLGEQTMYHQQDLAFENNEGKLSGKTLLNAKASYLVYKKLGLFVGAKNILNQNAREYYGTDRMGSQYFGGLSYNL